MTHEVHKLIDFLGLLIKLEVIMQEEHFELYRLKLCNASLLITHFIHHDLGVVLHSKIIFNIFTFFNRFRWLKVPV